MSFDRRSPQYPTSILSPVPYPFVDPSAPSSSSSSSSAGLPLSPHGPRSALYPSSAGDELSSSPHMAFHQHVVPLSEAPSSSQLPSVLSTGSLSSLSSLHPPPSASSSAALLFPGGPLSTSSSSGGGGVRPFSGRAGDLDPELFDILQMASSFEGDESGRPFFQHSMPSNTAEDVLASLSPDRAAPESISPFESAMRPASDAHLEQQQQRPHRSYGQGEGSASSPYVRLSSAPSSPEAPFSPPSQRPSAEYAAGAGSAGFLHRSAPSAPAIQHHQAGTDSASVKVGPFAPSMFMGQSSASSEPAFHRRSLSSSGPYPSQPLPSLPSSATSSSSTPSSSAGLQRPPLMYPQNAGELQQLMQRAGGTAFAHKSAPASYPPYDAPSFRHSMLGEEDDDDEEDEERDDSPPPAHPLPSPPSRRKRNKSPYYQSPGSTAYSRSLSAKREHDEQEEEKERMELQQIEAEERKERENDRMEEGRADKDEEAGGDDDDATLAGSGGKKERLSTRLARKAELARASRKRRKVYVQDLEQKCARLAAKVDDLQRKLRRTGGDTVAGLNREERIRKEQQSAIKERLTHLIAQAHTVASPPPPPPAAANSTSSSASPSSAASPHSASSPTSPSPSSTPPSAAPLGGPNPSITPEHERELHDLVTRFVFNSRERQGNVLYYFDRVQQCLTPGLQVRFVLWGLDQPDAFYQGGLWSSLMQGEIGLDARQMQWILSKREAIHAERKNLSTCELMLRETRGAIAMHLHSLHGHMDDLLSVMTPLQLAKFYLWVDLNSWSLSMISLGADSGGEPGAHPELGTGAAGGGGGGGEGGLGAG